VYYKINHSDFVIRVMSNEFKFQITIFILRVLLSSPRKWSV